MRVKVDAFRHAARWIAATQGTEALERVVAAVPSVASAIEKRARGWREIDELVAFLDAVDDVLHLGEQATSERIGVAIAAGQTKGIFRVVASVMSTSALMRRCARVWKRLYDAGSLEVVSLDEHGCEVELTSGRPHARFCAIQTGWIGEVARISQAAEGGAREAAPLVRHVSCRSRDDTRCLWEVRWTGVITRPILTPLVPA